MKFIISLLALFLFSTPVLAGQLTTPEAIPREQPTQTVDMKSFLSEPPEQFGGVGLSWAPEHDALKVASVLKGYPAERAGIKSGDKLLTVDGQPTKGMSEDDALKKIRGQPGTKVTLLVIREGTPEAIHFHIVREKIVEAFLWSPAHRYADDVKKLRPLARQGKPEAQNALGVLYEAGLGLKQDYKQAAKLYMKAAAQGDVHAQFNLGKACAKGQGVKQDYEESYYWTSLAALSFGRPRGIVDLLDDDEQHLTDQQIVTVKMRVTNWLNVNSPSRFIPPGPPAPFTSATAKPPGRSSVKGGTAGGAPVPWQP